MQYITKNFSNRQIRLGLVASCKKGNKYGILYGYYVPLVFFEKETSFEIPELTLASYLPCEDSRCPKGEYVFPVNSLVIHKDVRSQKREDGVFHDDETWRLITEGVPYFDYACQLNYCIYYPIIENDVCTIWQGSYSCTEYVNKEVEIYEMYRELSSINYSGWPSLEDITNTIKEYNTYIDSINAHDIIDTFEITRHGIHHNIPGKDDYYTDEIFYYLPNDDIYISQLLPTKRIDLLGNYDALPREGFRSGTFLLMDETMQARKKAKSEYSKEKHLACLISNYFLENIKKRERAEYLKKEIESEYDVENLSKIVAQFKDEISDEFIALINEYSRLNGFELIR